MKNIFEQLQDKGTPHAVCVSVTKGELQLGRFKREYYIIASIKDVTSKQGFKPGKNTGYTDVHERNLTQDEVKTFIAHSSKYEKVISNEHGRVYELKNKSFRSYYNKKKIVKKKEVEKVEKEEAKTLSIMDLFKDIW